MCLAAMCRVSLAVDSVFVILEFNLVTLAHCFVDVVDAAEDAVAFRSDAPTDMDVALEQSTFVVASEQFVIRYKLPSLTFRKEFARLDSIYQKHQLR